MVYVHFEKKKKKKKKFSLKLNPTLKKKKVLGQVSGKCHIPILGLGTYLLVKVPRPVDSEGGLRVKL